MSQKAQKQSDKLTIGETKQNVCQDNKVDDSIDRARMSWLLNLVFDQKTQQEIVKDIADGILDFKEIEEIFPWKFVQELRQCTSENMQNFHLNRFKNMTNERLNALLTLMLSRKSRDEILRLITAHSFCLDNSQKSYLRRYVLDNEEDGSSTTPNVSTSSTKLLSKSASNIEVKNRKEPKDVGTKKKRNTVKKGEKDTNTKKNGNTVEKATKKVRNVKSKKEKPMVDGTNTVGETSKEISSTEENPLPRMDGEKTSDDLTESLMQTRHEGFEESSLKPSEEDGAAYKLPVRSSTKKTANSKSLASNGAKLASAKKASKKVGKDVKPGVRNKGKHEIENVASLSRTDNCSEEKENSRSDESDVENARTSYGMRNDCLRETRSNEGLENSLQKSQTNQISNISYITDEEQGIHSSKENVLNHVQGCNFNIQLDTSTPKKLNYETKRIWIKEEPKGECSFNQFDYPNDRYEKKVLNTRKNAFKEVDSERKLRTKSSKARPNAKLSNTGGTKSKKITETSNIAKTDKNRNCAKKETTGRNAKDTGHKKNTKDRTKSRRLDRKERRKIEKMRRREKKMQEAMEQFSSQVVKLMKNMKYAKVKDKSSSSCSSESSYSSSSESCSCSSCDCCDSFSSDEYSDSTLCSCSNCDSSYSDSDYDDEE